MKSHDLAFLAFVVLFCLVVGIECRRIAERDAAAELHARVEQSTYFLPEVVTSKN